MRDFFLPPALRRRLEQQLRATQDADVFRRTLAVLEAAAGRPVTAIASLLRTSRPSIYHWLQGFRSSLAPGSLAGAKQIRELGEDRGLHEARVHCSRHG